MKLTFVDPTMDPRLLDWASSKDISGCCSIYRFYTIYMYGKSLDNLIPSNDCMQILKKCGFGDSNTIEFDQRYAAELLCDPMKFVDLVTILLSLQRDHIELSPSICNAYSGEFDKVHPREIFYTVLCSQ